MTQQEKQLLLKDLSARLPYGVIYHRNDGANIELREADIKIGNLNYTDNIVVRECKPYLRPMSSMTKEEKKEFSIFIGKTETYVQQVCLDADSMINPVIGGYKCVYWGLFDKCIDWLLEHHFDYRGLIERGLALEAPDDMYKTE